MLLTVFNDLGLCPHDIEAIVKNVLERAKEPPRVFDYDKSRRRYSERVDVQSKLIIAELKAKNATLRANLADLGLKYNALTADYQRLWKERQDEILPSVRRIMAGIKE